MTTPLIRPRRRRWRLALLVTGLLVVGLVATIVGTLMLSRDAAWLRDQMVAKRSEGWATRVQFSAGPAILATAHAVVSRIDDVPREARVALGAVRRASVGVYEREGTSDGASLNSLAIPTDRPGWERIVTVRGRNETVVIYAKVPRPGADRIEVAVGVRERSRVVVVSATLAPEGLMALLSEQAPRVQVARAE